MIAEFAFDFRATIGVYEIAVLAFTRWKAWTNLKKKRSKIQVYNFEDSRGALSNKHTTWTMRKMK